MPRPRSLTPERIAAAALAVLDREGLEGMSMRTVARELGMSAMALYRYVADRERLEQLVVDLVLAEVDVGLPARSSWTARVTLLLERVREAAGAHPAVVPLLVTHRHSSAASRRLIETMLGVLAGAGFDGTTRVIAQRTLVSFLLGALQSQHLGSLAGAGTAELAALPPEEYPYLGETAGHARRISAEREFRDGLAVVLRGLHATLRE